MSREAIKRWTTNLLSWKSRRRLLVIESDDWGMIRMASREAFKRLQARGYGVRECPHNTFDALEAADDLEALTETVLGFRDQRQRPPVLTANMVMGSPDFAAIRDAGFRAFHVTPVWETLKNHGRESAIAAYRQAREPGMLRPQLHGRDHVAVGRWLETLQRGEQRFVDAFDEGMFTVHPGGVTSCRRDLLDALGSAPNDPAFAGLATALKQAQEWFVTDWIHDANGTAHLIDINGRLSGAVAVPFSAGMDLPWIWYQVAAGIDDIEAEDALAGVRVRWRLGDGIALVEHLLAGKVRQALTIVTPQRGVHHDDFVWRDPVPFIAQALDYFWKVARDRGSTRPKTMGMVR